MCLPRSMARMPNISRLPRVCVAAKYVIRRSLSLLSGLMRPLYDEKSRYDMLFFMTSREVKQVLDRVLTWPKKRQKDAVQILESMEEQDKSPLRLTDEQAAEVLRRLREKNPKTISAEEVFKRLRRRYGA